LGSSNDPIYLNGDSQYPNYGITFTSSSSNWNETTGAGCIIENSILNSIELEINSTSPKIDRNSINGFIDAHITASPIITNNNITGGNSYQTAITGGFSSIISNNTITSNHNIAILAYDSTIISNNTIEGSRQKGSNAHACRVYNNKISNCTEWGLLSDSSTIQNNLIANCYQAVVTSGFDNIFNNTISSNSIAIYAYNYPTTITYNNIENSTQYCIKLDITEKYPLNATYNWWGTTDQQAINQSIYDSKNDFNLGTVNFVPFLTSANLQAMPNINAPMPTPNPSSSPSHTPSVPEFPAVMIVTTVLLIASIATVVHKRKSFILTKF
jgi:hypothetical protein